MITLVGWRYDCYLFIYFELIDNIQYKLIKRLRERPISSHCHLNRIIKLFIEKYIFIIGNKTFFAIGRKENVFLRVLLLILVKQLKFIVTGHNRLIINVKNLFSFLCFIFSNHKYLTVPWLYAARTH